MPNTKQCPTCGEYITSNNYKRHTEACSGEGTWQTREAKLKAATAEKAKSHGHVCSICHKAFSTSQALGGHVSRSHTNLHKAAEYSRLGKAKQAEMRAAGHVFPTCVHTPETKERLSLLMIDKLDKKPFWSKRELHNGITLHSSYEGIVARSLDDNHIIWERPRKALKYFDGVQNRHYLPDFYLPDYDVFLDPKNDFLIKKDARKIQLASEQNKVKIYVLDKHHLTWDNIQQLLQ